MTVWGDYLEMMEIPSKYLVGVEPKGTITLKAQTRVNHTTLASKDLPAVMATVKHKLLKQLFEQLEGMTAVKITSVKSPTTASITFHASLELVPPNDEKA
jgi:hypothetical protein